MLSISFLSKDIASFYRTCLLANEFKEKSHLLQAKVQKNSKHSNVRKKTKEALSYNVTQRIKLETMALS